MKHNLLKGSLLTLLTLSAAPMLLAQDAVAGADPNFYSNFLSNGLLLFVAFIIIGAFLVLYRLLNMMIKMQQLQIYKEQGFEAYQEAVSKPPMESFWNRMYKRWTNVVPVSKEEDILFDHNYDGIRELDNSLPPWWVAMFFITIAFGGVYLLYYHVTGAGMSSSEQYEAEMKRAEVAVAAFRAKQATVVDEDNLTPLTAGNDLAAGETLYKANCLVCHGGLGEGGVGPNLTDAYWIHGGGIKNVYQTIKNGVPEKGMIAWKNQLRPADMHRVASFILTLQGTNPPNGKAPEGNLYEPETPAADTTATEQSIGMN